MDAERFDRLARSLTTRSRRGFSRALAGFGLAGGLSALLSLADGEAKKRKHRNRKKKCKGSRKKCGKKCIPADGCCTAADCAAGQNCCANECTAPLSCGEDTCGCGDVCKRSPEGHTCQPGGCSATDYCHNRSQYQCGSDGDEPCFCTTSIDGVNACVKDIAFNCPPCDSDEDCVESLGQPSVCLADGPFCNCGGASFCALLCTDDSALRASERSGRSQRKRGNG